MPVKVNGQYLVPAPLVDFNKTYLSSENGETLGSEYSITLAGTILPNKGNPIVDSGTFLSSFSQDSWVSSKSPDDDPNHGVGLDDSLLSLMGKQEQIRKLFSNGQSVDVEILDLNLSGGGSGIKFVGRVDSINFPSEGRWVNPCPYTVNLSTSSFKESVGNGEFTDNHSEDEFQYFIRSASDSWSLSEDDAQLYDFSNTDKTAKTFTVTHAVNVVGQSVYESTGVTSGVPNYVNSLAPWQQASGYAYTQMDIGANNVVSGIYFNASGTLVFGDSFLGNSAGLNNYIVADRMLTEDIDVAGGSYSINETFRIFPSGSYNNGYPVIHTTEASINRAENGISSVSINGDIVGLNTYEIETSGAPGANRLVANNMKNARDYYVNYLNSDVTSGGTRIYHLARQMGEFTWLHPEYLSKTEGINPKRGTINYSYSFNDRPPHIIPNSINEDINVSDVYPGQIISSVPVIGRNQPVIQFLNARTGYKRTLSLNVQMKPFVENWLADTGVIIAASGFWNGATDTLINNWTSTNKPSVLSAAEFTKIFDAVNPANEVGVVSNRVFYSAPNESWNPKTGSYTYSITWDYEKTT